MSWRDMTSEQILAIIQQTVKDIESHMSPKPIYIDNSNLRPLPTVEQAARVYRQLGVVMMVCRD